MTSRFDLVVLGAPRDRCSGHCCRVFSLPYDPAELQACASQVQDGEQIAAMVIPLGKHSEYAGAPRYLSRHDADGGLHLYTCRNLDTATGDCRVYETRPAMCRNFPYERACPYQGCTAPTTVAVEALLSRIVEGP